VRDKAEFAALGHALLAELLPLPQPVRLMGLTLSSLAGEELERPAVSPAGAGAQLSLW
jgi:DNA polymerase-4